uniref:Uncharacterized protein MANES_17G096900 n=1 Tax=Rhizophora mucronata TaxID=61149 RepID=A0A2P2PER4_RHIMU
MPTSLTSPLYLSPPTLLLSSHSHPKQQKANFEVCKELAILSLF